MKEFEHHVYKSCWVGFTEFYSDKEKLIKKVYKGVVIKRESESARRSRSLYSNPILYIRSGINRSLLDRLNELYMSWSLYHHIEKPYVELCSNGKKAYLKLPEYFVGCFLIKRDIANGGKIIGPDREMIYWEHYNFRKI